MTSGTPRTMSSNTPVNYYKGFQRGWYHKQEQLLAEITEAVSENKGDDDDAAKELISRALRQFEEYYEHKSRATHDAVFSHFSPPWCSSFECAFMWITGFRPGVLIELVSDSVHNLSPRQIEAIHRLKKKTRMEEKQLADELARIQENVAAPPIIHALRGAGWAMPLRPTTNEPIDQLQVVLEEVVANADSLRVSTAASVAEILTPAQGLRFLSAALRVQQGMRTLQNDRDNRPQR